MPCFYRLVREITPGEFKPFVSQHRALVRAPSTGSMPGSPITVGGDAGTIEIQGPGTCTSLGGEKSIAVDVGPQTNGWLQEAWSPSP